MKLDKLAKPTVTMRSGMKIRDLFAQCSELNVAGLPFVNAAGEVIGRLSIRNIFKETCIPRYILNSAHLLGDDVDEVNIPRQHAFDLLEQSVDGYVLKRYAHATPNSPIIKGLAIMEQLGTSYIFVIDESGYQGIVTRRDIALRMIEATRDFTL